MVDEDNIALSDFSCAVIRLVTYVNNSERNPRLVFGSVALLTRDRLPPPVMENPEKIKIPGNGGTLWYKRTVLSVPDAIDWYRSMPEDLVTPIASSPGTKDVHGGQPVYCPALSDNPVWPDLAVPIDGDDLLTQFNEMAAPFLGAEPARIHRRIGEHRGLSRVIQDKEVVTKLLSRIHVNLNVYQEYLGGLVLSVPDPTIKSIGASVGEAENEKENLIIQVLPRNSQTLDDCSIDVFDIQANVLAGRQRVTVPSNGVIIIPKQGEWGAVAMMVSHKTRGLLYYAAPMSFVKSMKFEMGVVNRRVKVEAQLTDSPRSGLGSYHVDEVGPALESELGHQGGDGAMVRLFSAIHQRRIETDAERFEQRWFDNDSREEALNFIRAKLTSAKERVIIADPYFGVQQINQFVHAISRLSVSVSVVTSRLAFGNAQDKLEAFKEGAETLRSRGVEKFSFHLLPGSQPALHDRFIVVDDRVWFLGHSLNRIGVVASFVVRVPDAKSVIGKLESLIRKSQLIFASQDGKEIDCQDERQ